MYRVFLDCLDQRVRVVIQESSSKDYRECAENGEI
jgi:hypothetical protein